MSRTRVRRITVIAAAAIAVTLFGAAPAQAHPLGNFSINHLDSLHFAADKLVDDAIVDTAEIPTAQAEDQIDADGNGTASAGELNSFGAAQCEAYRMALTLTVDGAAVGLATTSTAFSYQPGQAGLQTTRLECHFEAAVDFTAERTVEFSNAFAPNRVGWHEIIATGDSARIIDSPVPTLSITNGLRTYPLDLLSSPLDVRRTSFSIAPGRGDSSPARVSKTSKSTFARVLGPVSGLVDRVTRVFNDLVGRRHLTLGVGLLAIGLALILGASHALLPGHGKTVMAAYIAGRQGSVRDAVLVGATVTITHTGGVLLLGLALTLSTSLAGESVLAWLGLISGVMIAVLGGSLLLGAVRHRAPVHGHRHGYMLGGHDHDHDHAHEHGHEHGHEVEDIRTHDPALVLVDAGHAIVANAFVDHPRVLLARTSHSHASHSYASHSHASHSRDGHSHEPKHFSRRGLVGMGIAGGLVPSPSALVVLLSAIALGRTVFGVVLVIGYGLGMAATLTAAGILLVRIRDRYQHRAETEPGRLHRTATRWTQLAPYLTAGLVLIVGLGLALRSLGSV